MKILILTQPLSSNYGGLLQAYALQVTLSNLGHQVYVENRKLSRLKYLKDNLYYFIRNIIRYNDKKYVVNENVLKLINKETNQFISNHINVTAPIRSHKKKKLISDHAFDAYIVGSDQVWRPMYSPHIGNYFLDFTKGLNVKRIAYAASFGVDFWEFSPKETKKCRDLIQLFDAVSVREDSGIKLCKDYLKTEAIQMPDPTLLLSKSDYLDLLQKQEYEEKDIFVHLLDSDITKQTIVSLIEKHLNCNSYSIMPKKSYYDCGKKHIDACIYPPVERFIESIMSAKFVVTDSFHAVVFSLIFHKPFIVLANSTRGLARINSLLKTFDLQERLFIKENSVNLEQIMSINFEPIDKKIEKLKTDALVFIEKNLYT